MSDNTIKNNISNACDRLSGCMQVDLLSDSGSMKSLWLPAKNEGRYRLGDDDKFPLFVDVKNGEWIAVCYDGAEFVRFNPAAENSLDLYYSGKLADRNLTRMRYMGVEYVVYSEDVTEQSNIFHNYFIANSDKITVGRSESCDICYPNILVSRNHAVLYKSFGKWYVEDEDSTNGTFLNNRKIVGSCELSVGDVIYIMGLKIIIGVGFISVNNGNNRVILNSLMFKNTDVSKSSDNLSLLSNPSAEKKLFNRLPRRRMALEKKTITIEKPPMSMNSDQIPLMLRMGSSMVMGGSAALMGNYLTILSSVVFPFMTSKYSDKQKKDYEKRRVECYHDYLNAKNNEIESEIAYEKAVLIKNYPEVDKILGYSQTKNQLWERRKTDDDFMTLRIGIGDIPMSAGKDFPEKGFSMDSDPLENEMYELAERKTIVENAPVLIDFKENFVCGVTGDSSLAIDFISRLIISVTVLHSYDEVKTIFLVDPEDLERLDYIKYLPHSWNNQKTFRFVATTPGEAYQIGEYLTKELGNDIQEPRELKKILKDRPYYMIFALSKKVFDSMEMLKYIMQCETTCGVSIITAFDDVPKDCSVLFNMEQSGENLLTYLRQIERSDDMFYLDRLDDSKVRKSMHVLSNTYLKVVSQAYSLPKSLTFLEMFGVGKVEYLNPLRRWQESNPIKTLSTPVGVATDGSIFTLDLHQKYQGPHGLVAGMTGSGKSEFLITYILSMAINYHPDEVAFVLIDYKGGGLAGAFDNPEKGIHLPHLVGTITNLDGSTIQRSLISIQSELTRRQKIFNQAKKNTDDGTMDVYSYQKLYRAGKVSEPMPHLFIISDEFAELKQQEPEFMDNLISIARIGRSLGVHLILATQKPSGVVNDQIRSNTKFRVCLKVQDKADSNDMLNRPEAAELKETGRFYLQVGYNEFFALGQNAWSGAEYIPMDEVIVQKDDSIQVVDNVGQNVSEIKPQPDRSLSQGTQLVAVVNMLSRLAEQENVLPKMLWQAELEKKIDLDSLSPVEDEVTEGGCKVVHAGLGIVDDPENQVQFVFDYDFTHSKNMMIVGDSRSGKTTFIQSMLYCLVRDYSADELCFYIMDYSSRMLKLFKEAPGCGAVMTEENDAPENFFKTIEGLLAHRKRVFSEKELSSFDNVTADMKLPLVLVIIDNFSGLEATKEGEAQFSKISQMLKECATYGMKFIISCSKYSEIPIKIRQGLGDRFSLHQKEKFDYAETLVCKIDYMPPEVQGRGLAIINGRPLETQIATWMCSSNSHDRMQYLKQFVQDKAVAQDGASSIQKLSVTSTEAEYTDFAGQFKPGRIPLGIIQKDSKPIALPLKQLTQLNIYFGNERGKLPILQNLIFAARRERMDIMFVRSVNNSLADSPKYTAGTDNMEIFGVDADSINEFRTKLMGILKPRQAQLTDYCKEHNINMQSPNFSKSTYKFRSENMSPIVVIIENVADFAGALDFLSTLVFSSTLPTLFSYNIFLIGAFEPSDAAKANGNMVYTQFALTGSTMLFGGKYNEQQFCQLPAGVTEISQKLPYNVCLVKYGGGFYSIVMPCGHVDNDDMIDEDYKNIFE